MTSQPRSSGSGFASASRASATTNRGRRRGPAAALVRRRAGRRVRMGVLQLRHLGRPARQRVRAGSGRRPGVRPGQGVGRGGVAGAYLRLMGEFSVSEADALNFPPFARGFWGE